LGKREGKPEREGEGKWTDRGGKGEEEGEQVEGGE